MSAHNHSLVKYNAAQQAAIDHKGCPLLITAGAGTGKTQTLVGRLSRLMSEGVEPSQILMMTFTNKAAKNMAERAGMQLELDKKSSRLNAGTFHGIAYQLLLEYGAPAGYFDYRSVLGEYQTKRLWEKAYESLPKRTKSLIYQFNLGGPATIIGWNSLMRSGQLTLSELLNQSPLARMWEENFPGAIEAVILKYRELKELHNGMDFDDILLKCCKALENRRINEKIRSQYQHVLVDEYQDTSRLQARMLKLIAGSLTLEGVQFEVNPNLTVVGDPKQSIYRFLSADLTNITDFKRDYPTYKEISLVENYRSTQNILNFTNQILNGAKEVRNDPLISSREAGPKPIIHRYGSERMEARGIVRDIKDALNRGIPPHEIAVLSRYSNLTYTLEQLLVEEDIPFIKVGGLKLMNKHNIRQFIAFLEVMLNRYNMLAWETLFPMIPLIGQEKTAKLLEDFRLMPEWTWDKPPPVSIGSGKTYLYFKEFWDDISQVKTLTGLPLREMLTKALEIFKRIYTRYYVSASDAERRAWAVQEAGDATGMEAVADLNTRIEEIEQYIIGLATNRAEFLEKFLDRFKLDDSINSPEAENNEKRKPIVLSTIHSAKGLEWQMVTVMGLDNGALPVKPRPFGKPRAKAWQPEETTPEDESQDPNDQVKIYPGEEPVYLEEERRLFYVAATRAKDELHITICQKRRNIPDGGGDSVFLAKLKPRSANPSQKELENNICRLVKEAMATEEEKTQQAARRTTQPQIQIPNDE